MVGPHLRGTQAQAGPGPGGSHRTLVFDNGGATLRVGFAGAQDPIKCMPNAAARCKSTRRNYVGDELDEYSDAASGLVLRRPIERGYVVNWETQKEIWDRALGTHCRAAAPQCCLLVTEHPFALPAIQRATDEAIFEEYGFAAAAVVPTAVLAAHAQALAIRRANESLTPPGAPPVPVPPHVFARAGIVVDAGFSFTHACAVADGKVVESAVRRINLGGKALTNLLKEAVAYRQVDVGSETAVLDDAKEALCFVSQDVESDLALARRPAAHNPHRREFILPDMVTVTKGYVRDPRAGGVGEPTGGGDIGAGADGERGPDGVTGRHPPAALQSISLSNERFMIPEALLHPSGVGLPQAGLAEAIATAATATHPSLRPLLWPNVHLVGGGARMPGLLQRLEAELRPLAPAECVVGVTSPPDPLLAVWRGGAALAASPAFAAIAMTRAEYYEQGHERFRARMRTAFYL